MTKRGAMGIVGMTVSALWLAACASEGETGGEAVAQGEHAALVEAVAERSFVFDGLAFSLQSDHITALVAGDPAWARGQVETGMYLRAAHGKNNVLYTARDTAGIDVIDYSSPGAMRVLRTLPLSTGHTAQNVKVFGNRAYVLEAIATPYTQWKLRTYDVTSAANPTLLGVATLATTLDVGAAQLARVDATHLAIIRDGQLGIFDVSNPSFLSEVSTLNAPDAADVFVNAGRAYVWRAPGCFCNWSWVEVWDASNLAAPVRLGVKKLPWVPYYRNASFTVRAGKPYLIMGLTDGAAIEGVAVMDVSNPADLELPRFVRLEEAGVQLIPGDVDVVGDTALVWGWLPPVPPTFDYRYRMAEVDISNPAAPFLRRVVAIPE